MAYNKLNTDETLLIYRGENMFIGNLESLPGDYFFGTTTDRIEFSHSIKICLQFFFDKLIIKWTQNKVFYKNLNLEAVISCVYVWIYYNIMQENKERKFFFYK